MKRERVNIRIGGRQFNVPVYDDVDNTFHLAKQLQERLTAIEDAAERVDTQSFAVEAALEILHDLQRSEVEREADTTDMMAELKRLTARLDQLVQEYGIVLE